jgi:hypothetical protein
MKASFSLRRFRVADEIPTLLNHFVKPRGTFGSGFSPRVLFLFHPQVTAITCPLHRLQSSLLLRRLHRFCANRIIVLNIAELLAEFRSFPQVYPRNC